jgi:hypothetical protein
MVRVRVTPSSPYEPAAVRVRGEASPERGFARVKGSPTFRVGGGAERGADGPLGVEEIAVVEESRIARRKLAEQIAEGIVNRYLAGIHAVGLLGSHAHGDDDDYSDLNIGVVSTQANAKPLRSVLRRANGVVVHVAVRSVGDWLDQARTLTPEWPLTANQFLIARPIYDPHGWYAVVRETHLARLRDATDREFAALARAALLSAMVYTARARREFVRAGQDDTQYLLTHAAVRTALVTGLLARRRFRNRRDALHRSGLSEATLDLLEERQRELELELAKRGASIDASVAEVVDGLGSPPVASDRSGLTEPPAPRGGAGLDLPPRSVGANSAR